MSTDLSRDLASLRIERERPPQGRSKRRMLFLALALLGAVLAAAFLLRTASSRLFRPVVSVAEIVTLSPAQASVKVMASGYVVPQRKAVIAGAQRLSESLPHAVDNRRNGSGRTGVFFFENSGG